MSADPTCPHPCPAGPPAPDDTLEARLRPIVGDPWDRPAGLSALHRLGAGMRRVHDEPPPEGAPTWSGSTSVAAGVRRLVADALLGARAADRLLRWVPALDAPDRLAPTLGGLGLERVPCPGVVPLLPEPTGERAAPALDLGWAVGDLLRLVHLARATGQDPRPPRRLLAALWAGYVGAVPGALPDVDVRRAAVLRLAVRAARGGAERPDRERELDAALVAVLAERA